MAYCPPPEAKVHVGPPNYANIPDFIDGDIDDLHGVGDWDMSKEGEIDEQCRFFLHGGD